MTGAPFGTGSRPSDRAADGVSPVPASIPSALSDKEAFYFRSIYSSLRQFYIWACDEAQMVTIGTEVLGDNIDWLDCWLHQRGLDVDA